MTRFDEALRAFADANEPQMRSRVGSVGNRYATVQEVGRGRTRRLALQSVATFAAVAVLGAGTWFAATQLRTPDPAGPAVEQLQYLGDSSRPDDTRINCGVPLPVDVDQKVTTASGSQEVPKLALTVTVDASDGPRVLDLAPGATTLMTEDGVTVETVATWKGDEPKFWGLTNYAVLVDEDGIVVARSALQGAVDATTGEELPETDRFNTNSCTDFSEDGAITGPEYFDGTYAIHVITQLWADNRQNPVVQWVDAGLPDGAQITFDHAAYLAQQEQQAEAADQQFQDLKDRLAATGATLADMDSTAVTARVDACTAATSLAAEGLAGIPAMATPIPTVPVEFTPRGFSWSFDDASDPGWDGSYDYIMVFTDADGKYVSTAYAKPHSTQEVGGSYTSSAWFEDDLLTGGCDAGLGVPSEPGDYNAYLMVTSPSLDNSLAPAELRDLGGFANLTSWIPVGTYTIS